MTGLIRIDRSWTPTGPQRPNPIRFCSRCGQPSAEPPNRPELRGRVCDHCGLGMMLTCGRDAMPGAGAAFLIVNFDLSVSAVSDGGEKVFGPEEALTGASLLELVRSPLGDDQLARTVCQAAQRASDPVVMPVRLRSEVSRRIGTLAARIATCGPPRAALVVVEPSAFGRY